MLIDIDIINDIYRKHWQKDKQLVIYLICSQFRMLHIIFHALLTHLGLALF